MELSIIYNLLQQAKCLDEFMAYNNMIHTIKENESLTNNRERCKIDKIKSGKNKILSFISRTSKESKR